MCWPGAGPGAGAGAGAEASFGGGAGAEAFFAGGAGAGAFILELSCLTEAAGRFFIEAAGFFIAVLLVCLRWSFTSTVKSDPSAAALPLTEMVARNRLILKQKYAWHRHR